MRSDIDPSDLESFLDNLIEEKIQYLRTYEGVVENNDDPDKKGKVLVSIHDLGWTNPDTWVWAAPEFPLRGSWIIPAVGDEVKIYFDHGKVEEPIYRGYFYYDLENIAPETLFSKGVIFKTKEQDIQIKYDDSAGKLEIIIGSNPKIILDSSGIKLSTGDAGIWTPCIRPFCIFSGATHGGAPAGIVKLTGG